MDNKAILRSLVFTICALSIFTYDRAQGMDLGGGKEFSADMISRADGQTMKAKFYYSGNRMRTDMEGNIVITRLDRNVVIMVMPSERMYMEQPIDPKMLPKTTKDMDGEVERIALGKETVDGLEADKFRVVYMDGPRRVEAYQWLADFGFPVKMEALDGSWSVEYRNIKIAPQPEALFEPPQGFQKMSMPFGMGSGGPSLEDIMAQAVAQE